MTREEEIVNAAREYTDKVIFASTSTVLYFEAGAKWADEHPVNVWHPADEQPVGRDWKILIEDKSGCYWVEGKCSVYSFYDSWQKYVENFELTRWAYISDLLPKGGEL